MTKNEEKFIPITSRIQNMDKDELQDELAKIRFQILEKVQVLATHWNKLIDLQKKREKIEERLEEIGLQVKD